MAKPLRLALGALLIQQEYGYSDEEIVLQIQENPYLQYFCGYSGFDDSKPPFDSSSMVHFRKRITPEILSEINEMIIQEAQPDEDHDNDNDENGGTMIVDATCAPSQIRYPQDECERVEVERRFSLSKRKCGMGLVTARLQETAEHVIAMSILVLNLRRATAALLCLLCWLLDLAACLGLRNKKLLLVQ